jgi:hypothetical protein
MKCLYALLVPALVLGLAGPATAQDQGLDYGKVTAAIGPVRTTETDPEAAASVLSGTGPVIAEAESGLDYGAPDVDVVSNTTATGSAAGLFASAATVRCTQRNIFGTVLWRYNSRWHWLWKKSPPALIDSYHDSNWPSDVFLGWSMTNSKKISAWGHLPFYAPPEPIYGQAMQGTFEYAPAGTYLKSVYVLLKVSTYALSVPTFNCSS